MEALESPSHLTSEDIERFAVTMVAHDEFKEVIRLMKADIIRKWANESSEAGRENLWRDLQAVDGLRKLIQALNESDALRRRKEEAEKASAARRRPRG